jgi:hypothetical protein
MTLIFAASFVLVFRCHTNLKALACIQCRPCSILFMKVSQCALNNEELCDLYSQVGLLGIALDGLGMMQT